MFRLINILFLFSLILLGCNVEEAGPSLGSPSTSTPSKEAMVRTMAIRPAYSTIVGTDGSHPLSLDVWMWDNTLVSGVKEELKTEGDSLPVTWDTDNFGVATVAADGSVTAVSAGEAMITAHIGEKTAVAKVIVEPLENPLARIDESISPPQTATNSSPPSNNPPPPTITETSPPSPSAPYADRVVSYTFGSTAGLTHNQDQFGIVLGPPKGGGPYAGSLDVLALGCGGEIVLELTDFILFDGPGVDFTVFENAFEIGGNPNNTFAEPGRVAVSQDGVNFFEFSCAGPYPFKGCAGVHPTFANPDQNNIDPTDPAVSGGDSFDLADVKLPTARFIRIRDAFTLKGPCGQINSGFDLDAVAVVHGTGP